ncbi:MAG: formate C-acetyltransferase [Clostridia bacterium]|nr:formate C-acetyltransferase [Clostridia bacterium]MDY3725121.1 formate C-acetyltransferase [Christensenellaceae bacterium]
MEAWRGFKNGIYQTQIDVRNFIQTNYTPYEGDSAFLAGPTERTKALMKKVNALLKEEQDKGGVLSIDTERVSTLTAYPAGYIDKDNEIIVGVQTDEPLKRGVNPFGGMRMARSACEQYGYKLSDKIEDEFKYKTTHNDGVFAVYTDDMRAARHVGLLTGLPDAYGRGRIIGDYRRVALYGVDFLIAQKQESRKAMGKLDMTEDNIRALEEIHDQIVALGELKKMAEIYGYDISLPATNAREAVQWTYFGYLAAIKEQNGAAMSLGRVSTFLDIYFERDLREGTLTESQAQEIMDDFVIKLRITRQLRTPEYNDLFGGDPTWTTESVGGMGEDGRTLVTKNSYRMLNTLYNLGAAPEPNLTVLWSQNLPEAFKKFCARVSVDTDSIQYENDDVMRPVYGDDYSIACCVSAMKTGKQMQFFGARCNLAKLLLFTLNGGKDERYAMQVAPEGKVFTGKLDYAEVMAAFRQYRKWLCKLYVNTLNVIHYMHDKYAYEKIQMALHDDEVERFLACGVAGLSVITDSLSAIKYAEVTPVIGDNGLITDFIVKGDFPKYGNDDDRVDKIAVEILKGFEEDLKETPAYRGAKHTLSVLTITSNVVYGKKTGSTPDGRKAGEPFAPGANPMHGRDMSGALASLNSVAKIPYEICRDGISNTFSIVPSALGGTDDERAENLVDMLDGYFAQNAHHLNVNVIDRKKLELAMEHPELYPNITIRVSGYAVNFHKLSRAHQLEVLKRTYHDRA